MIEYRINLREWREERRRQRNRTIQTYLALSFLTGAGIAYLWGMLLGTRIEHVEGSVRLLQAATAKHQPRAQKVLKLEQQYLDLKRRMVVLQQLERDRVAAAHLWRILPSLLPEHVYFLNLQRKESKIFIEGMAPSMEAANALARAMNDSCYLTNVRITDQDARRRDAFGNSISFKLSAIEKRPKPGECPDED